MNNDKQIIIDDILGKINSSPFVIVTDYTGITVTQFSELRKRLREAGSSCQVAKNSFVKRALREVDAPTEIDDTLKGQTAIVTGDADICAAAKVLNKFVDEFKKPTVKSGILEGRYLSASDVAGLADLPPKEVLIAKLLGILQQPGANLVRLMNQPATQLVRVLNEPGASLTRVLQAKNSQ